MKSVVWSGATCRDHEADAEEHKALETSALQLYHDPGGVREIHS